MSSTGGHRSDVIAYLWPILLVVLMAGLRRERPGAPAVVGLILAFGGATLAIGPTFAAGFDLLGVLLAFGSGLAFAVYAAIRSFGRETHDVIGPSMGPIAVVALALHAVFEPATSLSAPQMLAIAGIGIAPLTLSNALWDRASRTGHTALISSIAYLTPLVSLLLLAPFGVASVNGSVVAGAVLVVVGAFAASGLVGARIPRS